ncbi:hypothetical protein [Epilithonimonas sp. UC225_85]|uniref:hypothetical protein n=1 Tax=Epilithonimonas sp. UC225_85 TaxID=3350167 RepID=UPI0036D2B2B8
MLKFLPIENIVFKTKLSKEQVLLRLSENIEAKKTFGIGNYSKPYIGYITGNNFEIERVINYRNSFLPQIKGNVYSELGGTRINVKMMPVIYVLFFMAIWFGGVIIGCLAMFFILFTEEFTPFILIPFIMLVFGIGLLYGAFKTESSKSKKDLMRILEAEIEQ